jgi:uncharacterized protein
MTDAFYANETARRIFAGFNRGDVASFADALNDEVVANFPFAPAGLPKILLGKEAVLAAMTEGRAMMESMTLTTDKTYWISSDETLAVEARGVSVLVGGIPYNNRYIFLVGFRDGLVILWREYFDSLIMQEALDRQNPAADLS